MFIIQFFSMDSFLLWASFPSRVSQHNGALLTVLLCCVYFIHCYTTGSKVTGNFTSNIDDGYIANCQSWKKNIIMSLLYLTDMAKSPGKMVYALHGDYNQCVNRVPKWWHHKKLFFFAFQYFNTITGRAWWKTPTAQIWFCFVLFCLFYSQ